eukprot:TRINITY_DN11979_c1_g7_i4.p2 TRINITY_DN11979_c1_g7~~TRINITY_DN11979_c1_g7_i4.p2  ORF type:complete len:352 (+),score=20.67 TRINITY_DN11979_c1_g7_i4:1302-2357(+)
MRNMSRSTIQLVLFTLAFGLRVDTKSHLLLPGLHSGLGNQAIGLLSAIEFARLTSRQLVLPPVLSHHQVAFGMHVSDLDGCAKRSNSVFRELDKAFQKTSRVRNHLRWSDLFDLTSINVSTINYSATLHQSPPVVIAQCGRDPTPELLHELVPERAAYVAIATPFNWRFRSARLGRWAFPLATDWPDRVSQWLSSTSLAEQPYYGLHVRVCDPIALNWHRGVRSKAKRELANTNITAALRQSLKPIANQAVFVASDLTSEICKWKPVLKLTSKFNVTCVDASDIRLDKATKRFVAQGHDWIPSFMILAQSTDSLRTIAMTHDCAYCVNQAASSFARLLKRAQRATRRLSKI